jgi:hypothetical protein
MKYLRKFARLMLCQEESGLMALHSRLDQLHLVLSREIFIDLVIADAFHDVDLVALMGPLGNVCGVKCPHLNSVDRVRSSFGRDLIDLAL